MTVSSAHQSPPGEVLTGARRRQLLDWSRSTGGLVIEDDYDRYDHGEVVEETSDCGRLPKLRISDVAAGLSVTLNLPAETDHRELEHTARDAGIALEAPTRYTRCALILGYGRLHETAIPRAVAGLSAALRPVLKRM